LPKAFSNKFQLQQISCWTRRQFERLHVLRAHQLPLRSSFRTLPWFSCKVTVQQLQYDQFHSCNLASISFLLWRHISIKITWLPNYNITKLPDNKLSFTFMTLLHGNCCSTDDQYHSRNQSIINFNENYLTTKLQWGDNYFKMVFLGLLPFSNVQFFESAVFRWDLTKCKLINENFFFDVWRYNVCLLKPDYVNMMI
jgi:hypothetical protein